MAGTPEQVARSEISQTTREGSEHTAPGTHVRGTHAPGDFRLLWPRGKPWAWHMLPRLQPTLPMGRWASLGRGLWLLGSECQTEQRGAEASVVVSGAQSRMVAEAPRGTGGVCAPSVSATPWPPGAELSAGPSSVTPPAPAISGSQLCRPCLLWGPPGQASSFLRGWRAHLAMSHVPSRNSGRCSLGSSQLLPSRPPDPQGPGCRFVGSLSLHSCLWPLSTLTVRRHERT